jgi:DNA (cytosine-5)-methyltransferase 1
MAVYYNDADPAACTWLRDLIAARLLPDGEVDGRSILEVEPADLRGFAQCHFFAGIGGWPYALRLAGRCRGPVRLDRLAALPALQPGRAAQGTGR